MRGAPLLISKASLDAWILLPDGQINALAVGVAVAAVAPMDGSDLMWHVPDP